MARLTCPCLNVNVFAAVKPSDWRSNRIPSAKLFRERCESVKDDVLYEVNLDVAGIVIVSLAS